MKKKILFLGRKQVAADCLLWLLQERQDVDIVGVLTDTQLATSVTGDLAHQHNLPLYTFDTAINAMESGSLSFDLGLSVLYWRKLKDQYLSLPSLGVMNFHPAPLPDYKGVGGYNLAILHGLSQWASTAHYVDKDIDTGDIVKVLTFPIDPESSTALTLERASRAVLKQLFIETVTQLLDDPKSIKREKNIGGLYLTRQELEAMKKIDLENDDINRKVRAFWFPPYDGAYLELNGKKFTLIDRRILEDLADSNVSSLFTPTA